MAQSCIRVSGNCSAEIVVKRILEPMWVISTEQEGETSPFTFRILPGNIKTVGRAAQADFIVDAALVSRLHCRLSAGATELEVVDLDSTNGTYVNGQRVERSALKAGDALDVGKVRFRISRGSAATQP
jgi:hypothetical protein